MKAQISSRSEAALKAAATRKANQQAKQDRHDARIAAYHSLPASVREQLDEAICGITSDYAYAIDAVAQEAYETATDALNELAEKYGRQLVMAAAEGEYLFHDPVQTSHRPVRCSSACNGRAGRSLDRNAVTDAASACNARADGINIAEHRKRITNVSLIEENYQDELGNWLPEAQEILAKATATQTINKTHTPLPLEMVESCCTELSMACAKNEDEFKTAELSVGSDVCAEKY
jgi:hypothetical protein